MHPIAYPVLENPIGGHFRPVWQPSDICYQSESGAQHTVSVCGPSVSQATEVSYSIFKLTRTGTGLVPSGLTLDYIVTFRGLIVN